jgi:hypothetical protein
MLGHPVLVVAGGEGDEDGSNADEKTAEHPIIYSRRGEEKPQERNNGVN